MTTFVNPVHVEADVTANVGSPVGVFSQVPLLFAAQIFGWIETATAVEAFDKEALRQYLYLLYAHEIWQRTAARNTANGFVPSVSATGKGAFGSGGKEFVNLQWDCTTYPESRGRLDGDPPIISAGYVAFTYYGYTGQLQPIRYEHQIFFPEENNADGVAFFLFPGATGQLTGFTKDYNGLPLGGNSSGTLNAGNNDFSGYNEGTTAVNVIPDTHTSSITVPAQDPALFMTSKVIPNWPWTNDTISSLTDFNFNTCILAYLVEAWQATAARFSAGNTSTTHVISGARNNFPVDYAFSTNAQWDLTSSPGGQDEVFGQSGANMYGYYASIHGGYMGRLQYVNNPHQILIPSGPDCTGWSVVLKPGVTGILQTWGLPRRCQGVQTPYGDISLVDGVYAGLG